MAVEKQTTINRPPEEVFTYLADISRHSEWGQAQHKLEITKTSDGPIGQGATFKSVGHQFGRNEDTVTITEYVPNQRIVYQAEGNAGVIRHSFDLTPVDGGVQVTKGLDVVQAKFPFSLFAPIVKAFIAPGGLNGDLERIKAKVEGGSTA
ncbi:MAG: SRPBCC family protein [Dehalococcoidia bacterium]|nr:SRPBCC family protein [Dehalococcoidia bacterium]